MIQAKPLKNDFLVIGISVFIYLLIVAGGLYFTRAFHQLQVQGQIDEKIVLLQSRLVTPQTIRYLEEVNREHKSLSLSEIKTLDRTWIRFSKEENFERTSQYKEVGMHPLSSVLKKIQSEYTEYAELFITDTKGLTFAATNPTTDLYQADERWWQQARKREEPYIGMIEHDENSDTWSVPLSIPIYEERPDGKRKFLGVLKAALDIARVFW